MMTREEMIRQLQSLRDHCRSMVRDEHENGIWVRDTEALDLALSALRPVSREQVERIFPGCDFCNMADFGEFGFEITKHYAKIRCALGSWRFPGKEQFLFCPKCGKPLTDEAVQMVMERLEALHEIAPTT